MISVVVPICNEEENLPELHRRLRSVLEGAGDPWEIIFVDDGSHDRSAEIIRGFHRDDPRVAVPDRGRHGR